MRGQALIPLSADNRNQAGGAAGDEIDVDIEPDTAPREVTVPPELADALDRDPDARQRRIVKATTTLRTGSI